MKERNIAYLRRYKKIITKIATKHGLKDTTVERMVDGFFVSMKKSITDKRMPTIKITNFGTFKPSVRKLNWQIYAAIKHLRRGAKDETKPRNKIKNLWAVKQRLMKEKKGEITWKEWRHKKID